MPHIIPYIYNNSQILEWLLLPTLLGPEDTEVNEKDAVVFLELNVGMVKVNIEQVTTTVMYVMKKKYALQWEQTVVLT